MSRLKPAHLPAQPPTRGQPPLPKPLPSILKKTSKLSSKPSRKLYFSVLCLPLDHCCLGNFLLVFQISSWIEILGGGGSHVESLEFRQLETATSSYICRMCNVLIIVCVQLYIFNCLFLNIPVFTYTLPY